MECDDKITTVQFRERLIEMAQEIGGDADHVVVRLREARERIADLRERVRVYEIALRKIAAEDYEPVGESFTRAAAKIANAALGKS